MDFGVMLKKKYPELNKRSSNYRKQTPFKGSDREIRGLILKLILKCNQVLKSELVEKLKVNRNKLDKILVQLQKEGFIKIQGESIMVG